MEIITQDRVLFGDDPIVFIGDPSRCMGLVPLRNSAELPVKLKRLRIRVASPGLFPCGESGELEIKVSARVGAGQIQYVPVTLPLSASAPPGTYEGTIEGAKGVCRPLVIRVLDLRRLEFSPPLLTHSAPAGGTFSAHVNVSNLGNVSLVIPERATMELHPNRGWTDIFHAVVRSDGEKGNQVFLDTFLKRLGENEPPIGRLRIVAGSGSLPPQEARVLEMAIAVPPRTTADQSYQGIIRMGGAALRIELSVPPGSERPSLGGDS